MTEWFGKQEVPSVAALLCDADGTLFPSEEPAYEASAGVANRFLAELGVGRTYEPAELQELTHGLNFRAVARRLAEMHDRELAQDDLERWVAEEKDVVTAHLRATLVPDPEIAGPLQELGANVPLAVVTSSAGSRLAACLEVTELDRLFEPDRLFSAETSLPTPIGKPDPAVYTYACEQLEVAPRQAVAVEDSVNGALSAVAAGCWTLGTVQFVPSDQRSARVDALRDAGVVAVVESWAEIASLLGASALEAGRARAGADA